ncbi:MAG: hypothetical protein ACTSU7_01905 [Candidatus Heimdallarchaeaceae archaeon]
MEKYTGIYRAKVLATDVLEEEHLGRIKVEVYPMLIGIDSARDFPGIDGIATDQLPWAVPAMPLSSGAGEESEATGGFGSFIVPEVGSFVWVFFEAGDVYQPVYFAEAQTAEAGLPIERLTNYPYTKVWRTSGGIVITINDSEGNEEIKVLHPKGTTLRIDSSGNLNVTCAGTTTVISTDNLAVTAPRIDLN